MDSSEFLTLGLDDRVATVTLNRPDVLNALNPPLMRGLVDLLGKLAEDDTVRCVVLTGAGKGFCAGGDVRAIAKAADDRVKANTEKAGAGKTTEQRADWVRRSAEASRLLHEMPKPTIAMINGACAGAGLSLAAACDFRYAAQSAVFRPSFLVNGVSGDYGGSWLWTRSLGPSKARQLYFYDQRRDARAALDFGLVDEIFADADLKHEVMARAHGLAGLPGAGAAYAKANLNAALEESFADSLDRESLNMMLARDVLVEARRRSEAALKAAP
jgi:2-(1,2-epoxy-1,2-dihydrophenyl)acetyl-CoA isomerase